ncbi:MAG: glycosyltransferase [Haliscomenobacter sp.]|nr:glycosyltransferase [Haliscomenobacter sp.]
MSEWKIPPGYTPSVLVSVVIPARNEASGIGACLDSILQQQYPAHLFEVIVVDDDSSDETAAIALQFADSRISVLQPPGTPLPEGFVAYKKRALETGVSKAKGDLILTTDADCVLPPHWLGLMASSYERKGWHCITGPVAFHREGSLFERFQSLDLLGMMLITGAGMRMGLTHLANGAAFGFSKAAFEEVGGYSDISRLASGDDLLLLHKIMARYPGKTGFLKTTQAVRTEALGSLKAFFQQRVRWGSKSRSYSDRKITAVLALVFLLCWSVLLSLALLFWLPWYWLTIPVVLIVSKTWADYRMLRSAARFFKRMDLFNAFWPAQALHILYIAGVGLASNLVVRYKWKGRRVK